MIDVTTPTPQQGELPAENVTSPVSQRPQMKYGRVGTVAEVRQTTRARLVGSVAAATDTGLLLPPPSPAAIRHMTEIDLARRWRMSVRTLQSWRWKKIGPPYLKAMGKVLYRVIDIETFEREHLQGGPR